MRRRSLLAAAAVAPAVPLLAADRAQAVLPSPLNILCLGDSNTAAYGDPTGLGYRRELGRLLTDAGVAYQWQTRAGYGWTCADWLPNVTGAITETQPDVVLLMIGTGDAKPSNGLVGAFESNYRALLGRIFAAKPGVQVCAAWVPHIRGDATWDNNTQLVSDGIFRTIWPNGYNQPFAPGIVGVADGRTMGAGTQFVAADGVHFTPEGHDVLGWKWFVALRPYLGLA